jgi:hypothetical protein
VGETLVVDANLDSNIGVAANILDYGLLMADSDELRDGSRNHYLYTAARISSNPDTMLARYWDANSDDSPGDVNVNGGGGVNVQTPKATQFFIRRTGTTTYEVGYSTDNLETLVRYGSQFSVEPSFEPDLVGFYSDHRGGNGTTNFTAASGTFDNLRIVAEEAASAQFTVAGDFTLASGATLEMLLSSTSQHSRLVVDGAMTVAGALAVQLDAGFTPASGDTFDLLDFGALTGTFASAILPTLDLGLRWDTSALLTQGVLEVVSGLAADFNSDGVVDAADYTLWRNALGTTGVGLAADANGDLRVDGSDYLVWKGQFGASLDNLGALSASVPEPPLVLGLAILLPGILFVTRSVWRHR